MLPPGFEATDASEAQYDWAAERDRPEPTMDILPPGFEDTDANEVQYNWATELDRPEQTPKRICCTHSQDDGPSAETVDDDPDRIFSDLVFSVVNSLFE